MEESPEVIHPGDQGDGPPGDDPSGPPPATAPPAGMAGSTAAVDPRGGNPPPG